MPELLGGDAGVFLEHLGKIALVVKMQPGCDIRQGNPRQLHQAFGLLDPFPLNVIADGKARFLLEQLGEIAGIQPGDPGKLA
ncbi:hypothetical protein D3C86_1995870 [compost metagenome]